MPVRVVMAGLSTRGAAHSAARAGFDVTALDAFGDLDQHPSVRSLSLPRDLGCSFTPYAAARAARDIACDAVAYLSNFENDPRAVATLAGGRELWGNPRDVLRRVRDPSLVTHTLRSRGCPAPLVRTHDSSASPDDGSVEWIVKPFRSGGGQHVRRWQREAIPKTCYLQEFIHGPPVSIVFVAAGRVMVPLGVSRQLVGENAFGVGGYRYCGNILAPSRDSVLDDDVVQAMCAVARVIVEAFDLVGLNGIDFVVRENVPYPIEVNPRWSSSMELVERAYGVSMFGAHAAACVRGALPAFDVTHARASSRAAGKAIVLARQEYVVGDTRPWLDDDAVGDVPRPGETIDAGHPICTVFAVEDNVECCYTALEAAAQCMYSPRP